jgi:hypothetical protein
MHRQFRIIIAVRGEKASKARVVSSDKIIRTC